MLKFKVGMLIGFFVLGANVVMGELSYTLTFSEPDLIFSTKGDGNGKVYAYDSDWNLLWSKKTEAESVKLLPLSIVYKPKSEENISKFRINLGVKKFLFFFPYESTKTLWELPKTGNAFKVELCHFFKKNWGIFFDGAYAPQLPLVFHWWHPMDRAWYLRFFSVGGGISIRTCYALTLPVIFFSGLGIDFCKAANVTSFLNDTYLVRELPSCLGIRGFGEVSFKLHGPFTANLRIGLQRLVIEGEQLIVVDGEKKEEVYNLTGLFLGVKIEYNWK